MKRAALYICYYNLDNPLVQSQVVAYLRELAKSDIDIHLLTFDGPVPAEKRVALNQVLKNAGITWHSRTYHKWPSLPATLYDVVVGTLTAWRISRKHNISFVHARNHVPAAMALLLQRFIGVRWLFDLRGLMAEEYADAGHWHYGDFKFRLTKRMEDAFLRRANAIVMLTHKIKDQLIRANDSLSQRADDVMVIPTCVDLERFEHAQTSRTSYRQQRGWVDRRVLIYVGKVGSWYMSEEMARFFSAAQQLDPNLFFQVLTQEDPKPIQDALKATGISDGDYDIRFATPEELPTIMCAADVSISFRKGEYSKLAASPTKVGESLAAGLAVVTNTGIGDCDQFLSESRVGVILQSFTTKEYIYGANRLSSLLQDELLGERCRELAEREFSLEDVGGPRYREVYERVFRQE